MVHDEPRLVHGLRRKAVLATLALHYGEVVSTSRLVDVMWGPGCAGWQPPERLKFPGRVPAPVPAG